MSNEDFTQFVSKSLNKTPPMTVTETVMGETIRIFEAPAGFQLEKYAQTRYPKSVSMNFGFVKAKNLDRPNFVVELKDSMGNPYASFVGIYKGE